MKPSPELLALYEPTQLLGHGVNGAVYRVRERATGRELALKLLLAPRDALAQARFQREATVAAQLRHPGIVRVHSAGVLGGTAYLVSELVEGQELADVLPTVDRAEALRLLRDTARALGFAHRHGVVHRDVKPANVLVDREGRIRVADFGLATGSGVQRLTMTGQMVGTPIYMSPEAFRGDRQAMGPASDTWALGVMLYEVLTGVTPFLDDSLLAIGARVQNGGFRRPRALERSIPRGLEDICLQALRVAPEARFPDGEAFAAALEAWERGDWAVRLSRAQLLLGALALLSLSVGVGTALALNTRGDPSPAPAPAEAPPTPTPSPTPPPATPRATPSPTPPRLRRPPDLDPDRVHEASRLLSDKGPEVVYFTAKNLLKLRDDPANKARGRAMAWVAAREGNSGAQRLLASEFYLDQDPERALPWLMAAARGNDPYALQRLGELLMRGSGVPRDPATAAHLFARRLEVDQDPKPKVATVLYLARLLLEGAEGTPDLARIRELLQQGVAWFSLDCAQELAELERAQGNPTQGAQVLRAFRRSCETASSWNKRATLCLGRLLWLGQGGPRDRVGARETVRGLASKPDHEAQELLGRMLVLSRDPDDQDEGRGFLVEAAANGRPGARRVLDLLEAGRPAPPLEQR